jgi:hypothetical protein
MFIFQSCSIIHSFVMSTSVAPETVSIHLARNPIDAAAAAAAATGAQEEEYWPLTHEAVDACDLSFLNDKWSEDMVKDGMHSIVRVAELPEIKNKENDVWKHLSEYSPPGDRGFMFSYGDDRFVTLVGDNMKTGHSGASMGWTMRQIEFIAKNGLPAYRERFLRRNN